MPNWCLNEVSIYCPDEETRDEVVKWMEGTRKESFPDPNNEGEHVVQQVHCVISFASILPEPEHTIEGEGFDQKFTLEEGGPYDWYSWRNEHWGVKWEPDIIHFDRPSEEEIYFELYTAWGPPAGIYEAIMEKWEDKGVHVNWFYREDGMQFAGWLPD
jgi:hypothetical protein